MGIGRSMMEDEHQNVILGRELNELREQWSLLAEIERLLQPSRHKGVYFSHARQSGDREVD
jgi:hypothetical protein